MVLFVFFVRVIDANHTEIYKTEKAITVIHDGGHVRSVIMSNEVKPWFKWVVQNMAGFIYHEATIHNPKGDVLPDSIDDTLKGYIKEKVQ